MNATTNRINGTNETNVKVTIVKPKSKSKAKARKPKLATATASRARLAITLAAGCGIPLLSLALSYMGGSVISDCLTLALCLMALCCAVLAVSLSHLAWAIGDITRSPQWASWCMAIAVDATLVCCEMSSSIGYGSLVVTATIVAVTVASMVLNCWAFTQHD